tara:strand:- start:249 stop:893 length:645 start_codon:yes stop_codon:yes gene_type:complete
MNKNLNSKVSKILELQNISSLRPAQEKSLNAGLLKGNNLLVCTPTASGKTLIAEMAMMNNLDIGKAIYIVPLKALASEKYKNFKEKYQNEIALSIGDLDKNDSYLSNYEIIITTSEKLDSLIRHHTPWLKFVQTIVIDEIHLLNDPGRGPTLEILITMLKEILPNCQIIALSATIGNPKELAQWLNAKLVEDEWRPVELKKGIHFNNETKFYNN